jgi:hypothetical protein
VLILARKPTRGKVGKQLMVARRADLGCFGKKKGMYVHADEDFRVIDGICD